MAYFRPTARQIPQILRNAPPPGSRAPDNPGRDATSRRFGNGLNPTQFESRQRCASCDTMQTGRQSPASRTVRPATQIRTTIQ